MGETADWAVMTRLFAKFGFVHRRLWQRDGTYRVAVLFGPPPLLGAAVAVCLYVGGRALFSPSPVATPLPPWAAVPGPRIAVSTDAPRVVAPGMELPAAGVPAGLAVGWRGGIQPVELSAAMDANVLPTRVAPLVFDQPSLDLAKVVAAAPATGRFVGVGMATLVVRVAGTYAMTLRLQRSDTELASCLERLVFGNQRVVSNLELDQSGPATLTFEPVSFVLRPGFYPIAAAVGCWNGQSEVGAGTLSVLIRHPGEQDVGPAGASEILQSAAVKP